MSPTTPTTVTRPFEDLIGYRLRYDQALGLSLELEVAKQHLSHYGVAHGGVALLLLDTIGGVASFAAEPTLSRVATISLTANFIRAVEPGLVTATAQIDQMGKSIAHLQMRLAAGGRPNPHRHLVGLLHQPRPRLHQRLTSRRQRDGPPPALEQLHAQLRLQLLHRQAQRRLGHVQPLGGATEVQLLREHEELADRTEFDHRYVRQINSASTIYWTRMGRRRILARSKHCPPGCPP